MEIVATGGRDYADYRAREHVFATLDELHATEPITLLAHGACKDGGADMLVEAWARSREIDYRGYPARFRTGTVRTGYEGPLRNRRMLNWMFYGDPDGHGIGLTNDLLRVVAFPGGRGTRSCVEIAWELAIPIQPCCAEHPLHPFGPPPAHGNV